MTPDQQLQKWVEGDPQCPNDQGECCPDFSCCIPSRGWSQEDRLAFQRASQAQDHRTMGEMCMGALGAAIAHHSQEKRDRTFICGLDDQEEH